LRKAAGAGLQTDAKPTARRRASKKKDEMTTDKLLAIHEAGHAVMAELLSLDPVYVTGLSSAKWAPCVDLPLNPSFRKESGSQSIRTAARDVTACHCGRGDVASNSSEEIGCSRFVPDSSIGAESESLQTVAPPLYVTIRESWAWLNNSGFCRSAKDGNDKPDKEDKRDDDCEGFAPLFVAEALLVASLTLGL